MKITSPVFSRFFNLGQSLFAAHGQHGVAEADENNNPHDVAEPCSIEPAKRFLIERNHTRVQRIRRQYDGRAQDRNGAPNKQNHHHHCRDDHDLQGLLAGFVHALRVLPPEVNHHHHGQAGREMIVREMQRTVHVHAHVFDESSQILASGYGADRTSQHIIEQKRGDGKFRQSSAHRFLDDAVHSAANEHAAGFDIERPNGITEEHDSEDEPGCALADDFFGVSASVIRGGCEIRENDRGRTPEGDESQHHRGGDKDFYSRF